MRVRRGEKVEVWRGEKGMVLGEPCCLGFVQAVYWEWPGHCPGHDEEPAWPHASRGCAALWARVASRPRLAPLSWASAMK